MTSDTQWRKVRSRLGAWIALSRLPFHTVGVLPFTLGGLPK